MAVETSQSSRVENAPQPNRMRMPDLKGAISRQGERIRSKIANWLGRNKQAIPQEDPALMLEDVTNDKVDSLSDEDIRKKSTLSDLPSGPLGYFESANQNPSGKPLYENLPDETFLEHQRDKSIAKQNAKNLEEEQAEKKTHFAKVEYRDLESSLRPGNTHLDISYVEPGIGQVRIFFVRDNEVGPDNEVMLNSGYVKASSPGNGLGTKLFGSLGHTLDALATETNKKIAHHLFPDSAASRRFFERQGYQPDTNGHTAPPPEGYWYKRVSSPNNDVKPLTPKEQELIEKFKVLKPDLMTVL